MIAKFNPTGTHVHKGFLKVRVDLYPDVGDKTYPLHYVQVPVFPPEGYQGKVDAEGSPVDQTDYKNWIDGLPKIWQLNPALCAFIRVPETVIKGELEDFTGQLFNKDTVKTLDDILTKPNSIHLVSPFMRGKLTLSDQKVQTKDIADLIGSVNGRFADLILPVEGGGSSLPVEPQTIDIGAPAINRTYDWNINSNTTVAKDNPANASGTIDTIEIWLAASGIDVEVATFEEGSANSLTTRGIEFIGSVGFGNKQTFPGLSIDVETNDYIGIYASGAGLIDRSISGGAGVWYKSGDHIPCIDAVFSTLSGDLVSIYGTGTEVGGGDTASSWWRFSCHCIHSKSQDYA